MTTNEIAKLEKSAAQAKADFEANAARADEAAQDCRKAERNLDATQKALGAARAAVDAGEEGAEKRRAQARKAHEEAKGDMRELRAMLDEQEHRRRATRETWVDAEITIAQSRVQKVLEKRLDHARKAFNLMAALKAEFDEIETLGHQVNMLCGPGNKAAWPDAKMKDILQSVACGLGLARQIGDVFMGLTGTPQRNIEEGLRVIMMLATDPMNMKAVARKVRNLHDGEPMEDEPEGLAAA